MEELNCEMIHSDEVQNKLPIFLKKWWLDVVAKDKWFYLFVAKNDMIAVWPIVESKKLFLRISKMPPLTQYLGPYFIVNSNSKPSLSSTIEMYRILLNRLNHINIFKQRLNLTVKNLLPFLWQGFNMSIRYTYRINTKESDLNTILLKMSSTRRRKIKKGMNLLLIEKGEVDEKFIRLIKKTFYRKGNRAPSSIELLKEVYKASLKYDAGIIINALEPKNKEICGTSFFIKDNFSVYYLIGAYDERVDTNGLASSLLLWEGIKIAKENDLIFDFEGSILEGVEYFFRSFGGDLVPYYEVSRIKPGILNLAYKFFH